MHKYTENRLVCQVYNCLIFWGDSTGEYSLKDTTQLLPGAPGWSPTPIWIGHAVGASVDLDGDGVDDLIEANAGAFANGNPKPLPNVLVYRGHKGTRWGLSQLPRIADAYYWNPRTPDNRGIPPIEIVGMDQDRDGNSDVVFYANDPNFPYVTVLYGKDDGHLPDTNGMESISLKKADGRYSLFSDVTGDGVPDLIVASGRSDFVKAFVGFKGQRLLDQFGSGNDSAQAGNEKWWGKPWATIWLPRKINPNWFGDDDRLFDLGDANLDGVGDIFAVSWPYVLEYSGGGKLDSLSDALINITPGTGIGILKRVGNIDGSGRDIIALTTGGNEIRFYAPTKDISTVGIPRKLPPGTGKATVDERREAVQGRMWLSDKQRLNGNYQQEISQ